MDQKQSPVFECSEIWFKLIKEGKKPVEGRKSSKTWSGIKVGDIVSFVNGSNKSETFLALIIGINKHKNATEFVKRETLERCLPGVESEKEGVSLYEKMLGGVEAINAVGGMLAFQLKIL